MVNVRFGNQQVACQDGETLLDSLLTHGIDVPYSCRSGVCQACLMQAVDGAVPAEAQTGLKSTLKAQGYFLACQCTPHSAMTVSLDASAARIPATITRITTLSADVMQLELQTDAAIDYRAGQYATLWRNAHIGRSYSIASVPALDTGLVFHIKHVPGGAFSGWLHDTARPGDRLDLQGPLGECFYTAATTEQPLMLVGTGTGAAPLYGIARDALTQGLRQPIHLFHGAIDCDGLYLHDTLCALAAEHDNFHYHASVQPRQDAGDRDAAAARDKKGINLGAIDDIALERIGNTRDWRVYLCGAPPFVHALRKRVFLSGARMDAIHADAFLPAQPQSATG